MVVFGNVVTTVTPISPALSTHLSLCVLHCERYISNSNVQNADETQGDNYRAFGVEVDCLRANLEGLETAVMNAQKLLEQHGARQNDRLSGGKEAISEVIGDYNATLEECKQLLATNRRYAGTTGPMKNIDWNISLMPQVNSLRSRIQMHNIRIQTVLKPFEM